MAKIETANPLAKMIKFTITKRTHNKLLSRMHNHYSQPKGFVGRNICYAVTCDGAYFGHIVGGSASRFLPGRHEFLGTSINQLNNICNNIFFNISPADVKYPFRNFTSKVVKSWVDIIQVDWHKKYGDKLVGFESLVEQPRTGELYKRAGWTKVGETKGYTCKRVSGKGTDSWGGRRVWNTDPAHLRPKLVYCLALD